MYICTFVHNPGCHAVKERTHIRRMETLSVVELYVCEYVVTYATYVYIWKCISL